jgi:hypothetical protein
MRILLILVVGLTLCGLPAGASERLILAQGSAGGSIGKQNKTLSGDEEQRSRSQQKASPPAAKSGANEALPATIQLNNYYHGRYFITLQKVGGNTYRGTWNHGYATQFTVTAFTKDSIAMTRADDPKFGSVTGTYIGRRAGNHAQGNATTSNGLTTPWDASW